MSTLDVVAYAGENHGGVKPANFLDIGGGASAEVMAAGLDVILGDPQVKSVFVNVFGGITACDAVANGIVGALEILGDEANKPLVVRLDGNNVEEGRRILADANHPLVTLADTMDDGADKAAELANEVRKQRRHMSIFLNKDSKVIVQGITGGEGTKHTALMLKAGTQVVGGVNARKAGTTVSHVDKDGKTSSCRCSARSPRRSRRPAPTCRSSSCRRRSPRTRGRGHRRRHPAARRHHRGHPGAGHAPSSGPTPRSTRASKTRIIGPNCPGIITPGESLVGITPANITGKGPIGLVSKSGTLTYQMMYELRDLGFSTAIGIGGDPVIGTTHIDALAAFEADPETKAIVMIGEIGGDAEERAADFIKANVTKPVVGYVAGFTAPEGKTMGHAGAIVSGSAGTAQAKKEALEAAGVKVGKTPSETAAKARAILESL